MHIQTQRFNFQCDFKLQGYNKYKYNTAHFQAKNCGRLLAFS